MKRTPIFGALLALTALLSAPASETVAGPWSRPANESPDGPEHERVYFTEPEALAKVFGESADSIRVETWTPTDEERGALEERLGWRVDDESFRIFHAYADGRPAGRAMITEEVGLYRPITFIVEVDPAGEVDDVCVMTYRESRGDEVRRVRFLRQYRGKTLASPIRLNRDIVAVTGATLSTRAINAGVRRVLTILDFRSVAREAAVGDDDGGSS